MKMPLKQQTNLELGPIWSSRETDRQVSQSFPPEACRTTGEHRRWNEPFLTFPKTQPVLLYKKLKSFISPQSFPSNTYKE